MMSQFTRIPFSPPTRPLTSESTRPTTSHAARTANFHSTLGSTSYQYAYSESASQRHDHCRSVNGAGSRPNTRSRRTGSVIGGGDSQQIICAVSEARGVSPTVGLAFVNISTGEAVLSQICDNQFYVRTCHKIQVFEPTEILIMCTSSSPNTKSKMYNILEEEVIGSRITALDRKYWSENAGLDYIQQLAFSKDMEAIKVAIGGNYFATCCLAAVGGYHFLAITL
jgi:DNA mismatch repair protein MSH4